MKSLEETDYTDLIRVKVRTSNRERLVAGTLLGADRHAIVQIDDYAFSLFPQGAMLFAPHQDIPGTVGRIGTLLGEHGANLFGMQLGRKAVHGPALMALNLDEKLSDELLAKIAAMPGFFDVKQVIV
jgi:D-3-phosphoglycerate dehydrogenase